MSIVDRKLEALRIIYTECMKHDDDECKGCCFGNSKGNCMIIADTPNNWEFRDYTVTRYLE